MPLPIDLPGKIICVGLNYRDHAAEGGNPLPERPLLFAKWANVLIGPDDTIVLPAWMDQVDYEAELGVVIGQSVKDASPGSALEAVRGYVAFNDVSARALQHGDGQWSRGKSVDTFGPVGELTPASEVPDPQRLAIRTILNGETMQDSNTSEMVFSVADIVAFVTQTLTLEPGDLIATGTPSGVGYARTPPAFLEDGDLVTVEIEGLAPLSNPVRRARA